MTQPSSKPPFGLSITYFLLSLLAPWLPAWEIANFRVQAARMVNAKNVDEFDVYIQTIMWAGPMMLGIWVVYFALRHNDSFWPLATFTLLIPSVALIVQVLAFVL